jgi:hypothetical protein
MKDYPYGCQNEKESKDIVIPVKLFDLGWTINWWLSEYDPESKVAFWYVTGFYEDEWGTVSLEELEDLELAIDISNFGNLWKIPRIEIDKHFKPTKFLELPFNKGHSH